MGLAKTAQSEYLTDNIILYSIPKGTPTVPEHKKMYHPKVITLSSL
jgi:hypothetical protein